MNPLMTSVSPSGHRISTPQPEPGFFRATKVGRCSDILRICAYDGPVQASYPATIKLTHSLCAPKTSPSRGALHIGFSLLIRRIQTRSSVSICGRPPRRCDFQRQKRRKPARCQCTSVSGWTIVTTSKTWESTTLFTSSATTFETQPVSGRPTRGRDLQRQ